MRSLQLDFRFRRVLRRQGIVNVGVSLLTMEAMGRREDIEFLGSGPQAQNGAWMAP